MTTVLIKNVFIVLSAILLFTGTTNAWWGSGHKVLTGAAVKSLPSEIPSFFRRSFATIADNSLTPDLIKNRAVARLKSSENPEHYFDRELFADTLSSFRHEYIKQCYEQSIAPEKVGFLPYAISEYTELLAISFAEYRQWPRRKNIRAKCLLYAGILAHYSQDLCQPLHTTIHFDGRAGDDGITSHTGIHEKVDALIEYAAFTYDSLQIKNCSLLVKEPDSLFNVLVREIETNSALVDTIYANEKLLLAANNKELPVSVRDFGHERGKRSVQLTADLIYTAWKFSENIEMDSWLNQLRK